MARGPNISNQSIFIYKDPNGSDPKAALAHKTGLWDDRHLPLKIVILTALSGFIPGLVGLGPDGSPHLGVGLNIPQAVVIHDSQISGTERFRNGQRYLRLGLYHLGSHLLHFGCVFLLHGNRGGPPNFRLRLGHVLVRFGLGFL